MGQLTISEAVINKLEYLAEQRGYSVEKFLEVFVIHNETLENRGCDTQSDLHYAQLNEKYAQIEAVLEREKTLNDMKSSLISVMAHEFRTPLAVIMTTVGILRVKRHVITDDEFAQRLHLIDGQIKRLTEMISEITFLNQDDVVGQILKPTLVDIPQFFFEITHDINAVFPQHRPIVIIHDGSCDELTLDSYLMRQVFVNLLGNAMKYSKPDTTVACRVECRDGMLHVVVSDQGIGIPPEDQPHLFDAFYRARNVGTVSGTGLGMWIVKRAVDTMGGTITFESRVGAGSSFFVSLPVHQNNPSA